MAIKPLNDNTIYIALPEQSTRSGIILPGSSKEPFLGQVVASSDPDILEASIIIIDPQDSIPFTIDKTEYFSIKTSNIIGIK